MSVETFTLRGLARASSFSAHAIEILLERGLLPPSRRRPGREGDFAFHREHLERLHVISRGLSIGLALDELEAILRPSSLVTCNDIYAVAQRAVDRLHRDGLNETAPIVRKLRALMDASPRADSKLYCPIYLEITGGGRPKRSRRR